MLYGHQNIAFKDTIDLYKPVLTINADNTAQDITYELAYSNVKCLWLSTPEYEEIGPQGRTRVVNIYTYDKVKLSIDQDIQDGWFYTLTTPNHPDRGYWWSVQGNPQDRTFHSNERMVYSKRCPRPVISGGS
jgi:hypothetical protein